MPNWCENNTTINFKKDASEVKIQEFLNDLNNDGNFNLTNLVPLNEDKEWDYNSAINIWGSKWEPEIDNFQYNPKSKTLDMFYLSAWSPISNALKQIAKDNDIIDSIYSNYVEYGVGFYGRFEAVRDDDNHLEFREQDFDLPEIDLKYDNFKNLYKNYSSLKQNASDAQKEVLLCFKDLLEQESYQEVVNCILDEAGYEVSDDNKTNEEVLKENWYDVLYEYNINNNLDNELYQILMDKDIDDINNLFPIKQHTRTK